MTERKLLSPPAAVGRAPRQCSRWLCFFALMLINVVGWGISPVSAQSKDIITFTGGQADPRDPNIYVIDAGTQTCDDEN